MINNSRLEEHYQHEHDADIEQYRSCREDFAQFEKEEAEEMYAQYEMEEMVSKYHGILGEIVSVDNQTMYVESMRKINLMGNIVTEYRGIITSEFGISYHRGSWLSNTIMYSDTAIDFLEERIDWLDKTTLVPVVYHNDVYRHYSLISLESFLIESEGNYRHHEPVYLCTLQDIKDSVRHHHPDYQDLDEFIDSRLYVDHLLDIAHGNDYEGEYNLNYESYCQVVSQFDSCDFYDNFKVITFPNIDTNHIPCIDDDLPF